MEFDGKIIHLEDLLVGCRFCMVKHAEMRQIGPDILADSDIPRLYKLATASQLIISAQYSDWLCRGCEQNLHTVEQIRNDFIRVDTLWKRVLDAHETNLKELPAIKLEIQPLSDGAGADGTVVDVITTDNVNDVAKQATCADEEVEEAPSDTNGPSDNQSDDEDDVGDDEDDQPLNQMNKSTTNTKPNTADELFCDICGASFSSRRLLLRHMSANHDAPNNSTCHICGKSNLKRLAQHLRDHRKADKFKCSHCPKGFNRRTMLRQHERLHTGERPFICEVCAFSFTSSAALKRHCKMHTLSTTDANAPAKHQAQRLRVTQTKAIPKLPPRQGIRLECPICHNTYVNRASIQPHMKLMHGAEGLAAWKRMLETTCLVCNEKFEFVEQLAEHKPVHIEHQCEICRRRFHSKITLDLHVKNHSTKERRHKCEVCEATYLCAFTLKNHFRRAHTDERPYQCNVCQNGFVERWELNTHVRKVHSFYKTLKPHQCTLCPETFKSKDALRSHTEKHTGQYRYWCATCNRNLHSGPLLAEHNRSYHPEMSVVGAPATTTTTKHTDSNKESKEFY